MTTKYFVQLFITRDHSWDDDLRRLTPCTPRYVEKLGSLGVYLLDGRNKLSTMIDDAEKRAALFPGVKHFEIRKGTFSKYTTLYSSLL